MQTRRKLKSEENDSKSSGGEKMTEEEKSRTDSLWKSFLSDTASSSKTQNAPKSENKPANVSLQDETAKKNENSPETKNEDTSQKSKTEKLLDDDKETVENVNAETESIKSTADDTPTSLETKDNNSISIVESESSNSSSCQNTEMTEDSNCSEDKVKLDTSSSESTSDNTKTNTKFSLLSKDKCKGLNSPLAALGRKRSISGISNILNTTSKVSKLSTLEKSKRDWNQFKDEHKIEEELNTFNRGKNGYLEKQDFLQRTDLRQFEMEKELRSVSRRKF